MKELTVGIIGCGVIAPTHVESYKFLNGVRIKWACDLVAGRTQLLADKYDISNTTSDYHDVLNDPEVDCISICTDHKSHTQIALDAIRAGKHILCEKALASSPEDVMAMVTAHKERPDIVFAAVFQHRYDRVFRFLYERINDGSFGTITAVNLVSFLKRTDAYYNADSWRGTWDYEGGSLLMNQSIHFIDLISWLFGGVSAVSACYENITHNNSIETEDTAAIIVKFKSGILGSITATSSSVENWRNEISISGTEGYVRTNESTVTEYNFSSEEKQKEMERWLCADNEDKKISANKAYYGEGHPAQIADFISAVKEVRDPFVGLETAAATVRMIQACYESSRTGCWIDLD